MPQFPRAKRQCNYQKRDSIVKSTQPAMDCEMHNGSICSRTKRSQNLHQIENKEKLWN